jgi:hypothetical protein
MCNVPPSYYTHYICPQAKVFGQAYLISRVRVSVDDEANSAAQSKALWVFREFSINSVQGFVSIPRI